MCDNEMGPSFLFQLTSAAFNGSIVLTLRHLRTPIAKHEFPMALPTGPSCETTIQSHGATAPDTILVVIILAYVVLVIGVLRPLYDM